MSLIDDSALNTLTWHVIKSAMEVHKELGPGLLELAYQRCLTYELRERGMAVAIERRIPLRYKTVAIECEYKLDLVVNNTVVVEVKAVAAVLPVHKAQLITYLKLTGYPAGLLLNFNVPLMKNGITRVLHTEAGGVRT